MGPETDLLALAQKCEKDLDALLAALRRSLKNGLLHIFDHKVESGLFTSERLAESNALLAKTKRSLKMFVAAAHKDEGFLNQYSNADFALRRLDIMAESIESIQAIGDLNGAIAVVGNASNDLHMIIRNLARLQSQVE